LFVVAALVGGCVAYRPAPVSPGASAAGLEGRTMPRGRTWNLGSLTKSALARHPELEAACARRLSAEAAVITAGARPNPTLSWSPTFAADSPAGVSPWTLGFTLDVPIETAGKRGHRIAQAQALANAARLNVASTAWRIRAAVRKALVDVYAATLSRDILTTQQATQTQNVELLEQRLQAGDISVPQVSLARVTASQAALLLRDAEKLGAEAWARLATAIGVPASALAGVELSFRGLDRLPAPEVGALRRGALLHRSDVLAALAEYSAADAALRQEIARQYPDLHLNPGYAFDQGENKYSLGLSLTLPVLNQNLGPIAEAAAKRREAAASFTAVQAKVIGEIDQALASYRGALRKLDTADALLATQRKRQQAAQASFNAGATDRLDLLQTQLELTNGELSRAGALIEAQTAIGQLEEALQHPAGAVDSARLIRLINDSTK
jgi:outer membrane protein TolC